MGKDSTGQQGQQSPEWQAEAGDSREMEGQGQEVPEEGLLGGRPQAGLCSGAIREDIHQQVPTYRN